MKRVALLTPVLLVAGVLAVLFLARGHSSPAVAALPETVQARYYDMTVTTSDGRQFELPDKTVTCPLEVAISAEEAVYNCPAPHNIESFLAPPQVSAGTPAKSTQVVVVIDAASMMWGLPPNSWQTIQIEYGATLNSANVFLGEEFTGGESGHIENVVWPDFSRGVHPIYFYYRAKANSSGFMGTEWLVRGTQ